VNGYSYTPRTGHDEITPLRLKYEEENHDA